MKKAVKIFIAILVVAVVFAGCGKKEEAAKRNLQMALDMVAKQKTPENYLNLSLKYYQAKQYEKCIEASQEALKLRPDYAPAYNNICSAYNEMKMWDKGIEACQQALKIDPDFQLAKNNLNWALTQKQSKK
jgi:tetratricopeptide (TPR) repeat protein